MTDSQNQLRYQPGLDGLRGLSVLAVILYHAGFGWMGGGFFGVEVFFVVSGFLITRLLIAERVVTGRVSLRRFWMRRARRLLPALLLMLTAVTLWTVFWGSAERRVQMRRDLPWSLLYAANWGQIAGDVPYFAPSPPLLRHLWSLAVEEQWYLIWPLVFAALGALAVTRRRVGLGVAVVSVAVMATTALLALGNPLTPERINFLYLSTFTRSSGLLLGAALAWWWRPEAAATRRSGLPFDVLGALAVGGLVGAFMVGEVTHRLTYLAVLPSVSVASGIAVVAATAPASRVWRPVFSSVPLVAVGRRSYGLYLWSWPVSAIVGADHGVVTRFALAMAITAPVNELSYRLIENPIRRGAIGRWWGRREPRRGVATAALVVGAVALVAPVAVFFGRAPQRFDVAIGSQGDVVFDPGVLVAASAPATATTQASTSTTNVTPTEPLTSNQPSTSATHVTTTTTQVPVTGPLRVVVVGDSQAHSFVVNLPKGIAGLFDVADGALDGCSIHDHGVAKSTRPFTRRFDNCNGWADKWAATASAHRAEVALVMIGAWDVLDLEVDGTLLAFGTTAFDQRFLADLQTGIDVLAAAGSRVALLEVACMRPVRAKGAAVPPLPERGDDQRVAHLNELLRTAARRNPLSTSFIAGPPQFCDDPAIAADLSYRWDGVHVYQRGAKLILDAIAVQLLDLPRTPPAAR